MDVQLHPLRQSQTEDIIQNYIIILFHQNNTKQEEHDKNTTCQNQVWYLTLGKNEDHFSIKGSNYSQI